MKVIVLSSKGGVGKSTFSIHFLAPYLFAKTNTKSVFFMADPVNKDGKIDTKFYQVSDSEFALYNSNERFFTDFFLCQNSCLVDVGGNASALKFLEELSSKSIMVDDDFVFFLPTDNDPNSCDNVVDTYRRIRTVFKNAKIIFVLTKIHNLKEYKDEYLYLLGDETGVCDFMPGLFDNANVPKNDRNCILIPYSSLFYIANVYKKTISELAELEQKFNEKYQKAKAEFAKTKEEEVDKQAKILLNKIFFFSHCKDFRNNELPKVFEQLDRLLEKK